MLFTHSAALQSTFSGIFGWNLKRNYFKSKRELLSFLGSFFFIFSLFFTFFGLIVLPLLPQVVVELKMLNQLWYIDEFYTEQKRKLLDLNGNQGQGPPLTPIYSHEKEHILWKRIFENMGGTNYFASLRWAKNKHYWQRHPQRPCIAPCGIVPPT